MKERARRRLEESLVAERSTQTTDSVIDALQYSEESVHKINVLRYNVVWHWAHSRAFFSSYNMQWADSK